MKELPDATDLEAVNDIDIQDFPPLRRVRRTHDQRRLSDVEAATVRAVDAIEAIAELDPGATVGITAGSRGITGIETILAAVVDRLRERGLEPVILATMGSHGGATAEGQRKLLAGLGITEEAMGCEIRSSMAVERIADDEEGRPIFVSEDALEMDAILLANRIKLHTDFVDGRVESGLCKMAVIGLGKQRGAEEAHKAAMASSFRNVLPAWASVIVEQTPVAGGIGIVENADEEPAIIEGVSAANLLEREQELFEESKTLFPHLPVEELDLLILDEIGKEISGTGMDTNVVGRMLIQGEPEPDVPDVTRIFVRDLTDKTDGNGLGIGLADFVHGRAVEELDLTTTYINAITGAEPERARIPMTVPADTTAILLAYSTVGASDPADMRIARIRNTLELEELLVSEPVADQLRDRERVSVGDPVPFPSDGDDFGTEL
jgi:hypothetical protein